MQADLSAREMGFAGNVATLQATLSDIFVTEAGSESEILSAFYASQGGSLNATFTFDTSVDVLDSTELGYCTFPPVSRLALRGEGDRHFFRRCGEK